MRNVIVFPKSIVKYQDIALALAWCRGPPVLPVPRYPLFPELLSVPSTTAEMLNLLLALASRRLALSLT